MSNQTPNVPPFAGVSRVPNQQFKGIRRPSDQFDSVQNQLVTPPLSGLIDLSTARSIAAGTALVVNVAGNSFYLDANTDVGNAVIHFQDVSQQVQQQGMYIGPQFIAKIPFTRFLLENLAQPLKLFRFFYGVDVDFSPGLNNQVSIAGTVSVVDLGASYGAAFSSNAALGIAATEQVWAAASNVNGANIWLASGNSFNGTANTVIGLHAKTSAPVVQTDGDVIIHNRQYFFTAAGVINVTQELPRSVRIAIGKGLWWLNVAIAETGAFRRVLYTLS